MEIEGLIYSFAQGPVETIAIGPSALEPLALDEMVIDGSTKIAIPENLLRLLLYIRDGSERHRRVLVRVLHHFRPRWANTRFIDPRMDEAIVDRLMSLIERFEAEGRIVAITDEVRDEGIEHALRQLFPGPGYEIELSPKRNFLREYLVLAFSWSKKTGGAILEKTRRIFSDVGRHIATLQLPDKLDGAITAKSRFFDKIYAFRGGRATKFFVAGAVAVTGVWNPAIGAAGIVLVFMDP